MILSENQEVGQRTGFNWLQFKEAYLQVWNEGVQYMHAMIQQHSEQDAVVGFPHPYRMDNPRS